MPPAVAAAGSIAGSMAAQKLMGSSKQAPPGGGTPGLTTSTGSGKDGTKGASVQIDPNQVMAYYQQAAQVQSDNYKTGLQYYQQAMTAATNEVNKAFTEANNTLKPLSFSSNQALNEQMRMMGLDPIQATAGNAASLRNDYATIAGQIPGLSTTVGSVADQMDAATKIKDPTARAAAIANINNTVSTGVKDTVSSLNQQIAALAPSKPTAPTVTTVNAADQSGGLTGTMGMYNYKGENFFTDGTAANNAYNADMAAYNSQLNALQSQLSTTQSYGQQLTAASNNFASNYGENYDSGYTGDQVEARIAATPGYKFVVDQGTKAIERQGAASGMLGSANTQLALQDFGQKTGQSFYNSYMDNLSKIVNEGSGATQQIATNQVSQGGMLANIQQLGGQAAMSTYQAIGDFAGKNLQQQGAMWAQIAQANAGLQQNQQGLNIQQQQANQSGQYQSSMANAANTTANAGMISAIGGL